MSLLAFLGLNQKWMSMDSIDLYKLAYEVSNSGANDKGKVLKRIEKTIKEHLIDFPQSKS